MLRKILAGALGKAKSEHELGLPTIDGLTVLASHVTGHTAFGLFRIEQEGQQLLTIAGANGTTSGAYSVTLFMAGDANRDGRFVDRIGLSRLLTLFSELPSTHNFLH